MNRPVSEVERFRFDVESQQQARIQRGVLLPVFRPMVVEDNCTLKRITLFAPITILSIGAIIGGIYFLGQTPTEVPYQVGLCVTSIAFGALGITYSAYKILKINISDYRPIQ